MGVYEQISIHALLAESDLDGNTHCAALRISIHALLAESDWALGSAWSAAAAFLSTLSLRRATCRTERYLQCKPNFYPRSPCGERRVTIANNSLSRNDFYPRSPCGERRLVAGKAQAKATISIHALLAESDVLQS